VYDPSQYDGYHYPAHPNVVTSLEFERILSEGGPYGGQLLRPSDQKEPQKDRLAPVRGLPGHEPLQQQLLFRRLLHVRHQAGGGRQGTRPPMPWTPPSFFMDMRTHGKDYERYYNRAKNDYGVRFIRSRVHSFDPVHLTPTTWPSAISRSRGR
jgi:heterodisulfide reductase subunit A2